MSKDLTRRTDITKSEQTKTERTRSNQTEVERAQEALAEKILFGASARPQDAGSPGIVLVFDCTSSMGEYIEERRITLEAARSIACSLFAEQRGLRVRLGFFRGDGEIDRPSIHGSCNSPRSATASLRSWRATSPPSSIGRVGRSIVGSCVL